MKIRLARYFFKFYYGKMSEKTKDLLRRAEAPKDSSEEGKSSVSRAEREFRDETEAESAYQKYKLKLFNVNGWEADSGVSAFRLFDETGAEVTATAARTGNFIRITMPGSGKNDWVRIVEIYENSTETVITVQPTVDPTDGERETTSHFFQSEANNNFCLQRRGAKINLYVIGLNEKANTDESAGLIESVRNVAVASLGWLGFQKIEWQTFCENFLKDEK